ncbi:tetratricopeptide repeat protein [Nitzschia inconspicua]|uniref:Tetratricopeptide repeat protein n=1 Tax=Nitzschia inconspicua TaxID=303405 RepID=A0A9K3PHG0_9STRA|nr:tetratricopeptide repeat protein [Nitzschia inconspicua]
MDRCARLNNVGASHLANGMYSDAIDSFTGSLRIVKSTLSVLATEKHVLHMNGPSLPSQHSGVMQEQNVCPVIFTRDSIATYGGAMAKSPSFVDRDKAALVRGLYVSPLFLSESVDYARYETTVEASVAVMFNLALAHHLNSLLHRLHGHKDHEMSNHSQRTPGVSTLGQATALYELAYTVHMQEDVELSVEFTMAIINNLGHTHRLMGDKEKADQCFRHLLSTILFVRSYGGGQSCDNGRLLDIFVYSVSHLILRETAAAAA